MLVDHTGHKVGVDGSLAFVPHEGHPEPLALASFEPFVAHNIIDAHDLLPNVKAGGAGVDKGH